MSPVSAAPHSSSTLAALALGSLLAFTGCAALSAPEDDPPRVGGTGDAREGAEKDGDEKGEEKATPPPDEQIDDRPVTLAFAGDVHFEEQLRDKLTDPDTALDPIAPPLADADLTVVNLETAIATAGEPEPKNYTFRTPPEGVDALAAAGIDVLTMANNHGVDYGADGLEETFAVQSDGPLDIIGVGRNTDEAFAPAIHEVRGTTIAVLAATAFANDPTVTNWPAGPSRPGIAVALDPERLLAGVREATETADVVVVYLHWGTERQSCPEAAQTTLAGQLADAGADIIVGSHAHVLQGAGYLGEPGDGPFVAYGLGNFVWYGRNSEQEATTGVLTLTVPGRGGAEKSGDDPGRVVAAEWTPAEIHADGVPRIAEDDRAATMIEDFWELGGCAGLTAVDQG